LRSNRSAVRRGDRWIRTDARIWKISD
jgi:hypothetical protein